MIKNLQKMSLLLFLALYTFGCSVHQEPVVAEEAMYDVPIPECSARNSSYTLKTKQAIDLDMFHKINRIIYEIESGPVAPEYHTTETIIVTKNNISKTIYGKYRTLKIAEGNTTISSKQFQKIKQSFLDNNISKCELVKTELKNAQNNCMDRGRNMAEEVGCDNAYTLALLKDKEQLFAAYVECGRGNMCGNSDSVKELILSLAPKELEDLDKPIPPQSSFYFDDDMMTLNEDSHRKLIKFLETFKVKLQNLSSNSRINITGHTDIRGTEEYNFSIALKRVNVVKREFVKSGIPAEKISAISYGELEPVCQEHTNECFAKNRRVDVDIMSYESDNFECINNNQRESSFISESKIEQEK